MNSTAVQRHLARRGQERRLRGARLLLHVSPRGGAVQVDPFESKR
jgi:hypothetical protein